MADPSPDLDTAGMLEMAAAYRLALTALANDERDAAVQHDLVNSATIIGDLGAEVERLRQAAAVIQENRAGIEDALHNGRGMTKANLCWERILNGFGLSHLSDDGVLHGKSEFQALTEEVVRLRAAINAVVDLSSDGSASFKDTRFQSKVTFTSRMLRAALGESS